MHLHSWSRISLASKAAAARAPNSLFDKLFDKRVILIIISSGTMPAGDGGRGGAHRGGARGGARGGGSNRGRGMVASGQFTVGDIKKMDDDFDFAATTASFDKLAVKEEAKQVAQLHSPPISVLAPSRT